MKVQSKTALLLIDFINAMDFEGASRMARAAMAAARVTVKLRAQADAADIPVIYVNDNYDEWRSDRRDIVEACRRTSDLGRRLVELLAPREQDYFVIKPSFSGFYATNLPVLLPTLGVERLVLTGLAADICVLFTAADAHMRAYRLWAPRDGVAAETAGHRDRALEIMEKGMSATVTPTTDLDLKAWIHRSGRPKR